MIRQVTFGFLISMMSSCCYLLRLRRRKRKSVEVGDFRKGGSLWVQISDKRGSRPRITVGARKLKWFPFRVSSLEMKLSRKSTKLRRCTRLTIIVIVVIACNVYSWYIHSRCVSKNDTDVAHYNFDADRPISIIIFGRDVAERICHQTLKIGWWVSKI